MNLDNINRIRIINSHTGEVKETDACIAGVSSLSNVLDREINCYEKYELFKGRNIKQDIIFEGHPFFIKLLEKEFKQKFQQSVK